MKKPKKKLSITIEPKIDKLLENSSTNKSKLINKLLEKFLLEKWKLPANLKK
jgi:hypothetical protein